MDLKNLTIRTVSGIIYIGLIIGAILWGPEGIVLLCIFLASVGLFELRQMSGLGKSAFGLLCFLVELVSIVCLIGSALSFQLTGVWLFLLFIRFLMQIWDTSSNPVKDFAMACMAQFYLGFTLLAFAVLGLKLAAHPWMLIALISMIWINDTGAFLVGCTIGKHRLFPRLSPKKSWEGFVGGMIFNVIAGVVFAFFLPLNLYLPYNNFFVWIVMGILVTLLATIGDLFESMIKRTMGVKDSGKIIPGHGGILDRIDSLLAVAPGIFIFFMMAM